MKHGSEWYKRDPIAYLGGVQGMTSKEHAVFSVVLDLIYQHGGSVNDDPKWIAGWISDMGAAAVRKAIETLVTRGKLTREGDQLTQKRAAIQAETREKLRETRAKSGAIGGKSDGNATVNSQDCSTKASDDNYLGKANTLPREEKRREELEREEHPTDACTDTGGALLPFEPDEPEPPPRSKTVKAFLPSNWTPDEEQIAKARSFNLFDSEIQEIANDFAEYWSERQDRDAKRTETGWRRTWTNRLREVAPKFIRARPRNLSDSSDRRENGFNAAAQQIARLA